MNIFLAYCCLQRVLMILAGVVFRLCRGYGPFCDRFPSGVGPFFLFFLFFFFSKNMFCVFLWVCFFFPN